ncbi:MAG: CPBP family intramembrane metalloprotease [Pirellulales bacterium]|nr:CPBP family intramembrane metalloprotease [Pirellulales bacterium]
MKPHARVVPLAVLFEGALGLLAAALAWWCDVPIASRLQISWSAAARGCAATLPMLAALGWLMHSRWAPIADLRNRVAPLAAELFRGATCLELAAVAIAAGAGEELLFRGVLQPLAVGWLGAAAGLAAASLLFGLLHALTPTYFVLATAVALYLGWLAHAYDDLAAPIIAHAMYDFVALRVLLYGTSRRAFASPSWAPEDAP